MINKILDQIFTALSYLHSMNIVHQDFNMHNIIINPSSLEIKIVDFGLAKTEKFESQIFSPQGNLKYRPPFFFFSEAFQNRFCIDVWGFCLVVLSVIMRKKITTKKALKIFEKEKLKKSNSESALEMNKINVTWLFLETEMLSEKEEGNRRSEESPIKYFPCMWFQA